MSRDRQHRLIHAADCLRFVLRLPSSGGLAGARYTGSIDEIEVFNRALSQTEIQNIYNAGAAGKCQTPSVSIRDAFITPSNSGTTNLVFAVKVVRPNASAVNVDYATADGTAHQPTDYLSTTGTLVIPANTSSATISVPVNGLNRSASQTFVVNLSNPSNTIINRSSATGTILTANADVSADFSVTNGNPNGIWAYGWSDTLGSPLHLYSNGAVAPDGDRIRPDPNNITLGAPVDANNSRVISRDSCPRTAPILAGAERAVQPFCVDCSGGRHVRNRNDVYAERFRRNGCSYSEQWRFNVLGRSYFRTSAII